MAGHYPFATYATRQANEEIIRAEATTARTNNATYLAIGTPSAAQNTAQIRALTQQMNKVIRVLLDQLDGTN